MIDLSTDQITFTDYKIPSLPAGRYRFSAEMSIVSRDKIQESNLWQTSIEFEAKATRFKLEPDEVYSVSPPPNSVDNYAGVVPSIFFRTSSLPWLRKPDPTIGYVPWLALICIDESELTTVTTESKTVQYYCDTYGLTLEEGDTGDDPLTLLNIPESHHFLLPNNTGDFNYTAAVKNSVLTGEVASLMGLRFPAAGKNVVYLVSIENRLPLPTSGTWQFPILYSWSFECRDPASDSANVLASMSHGDLAFCLPPVPYNDGQHPESNPNNWLKNGYVLLPHQFRNGQTSVSWYKGPFSPAKINIQPVLPAIAADSLSMFDPATGILDVSYATAWQLGRQLALQSTDFSSMLYKWKRQTMLLDKFRQQVSDRDASLPVLAKVNRWSVLNSQQVMFFKFNRNLENHTWESNCKEVMVATPQGNPDILLDDTFGSCVYLNLLANSQHIDIPVSYNLQTVGTTFYSLWFKPASNLEPSTEYGLFSIYVGNTLVFSLNIVDSSVEFFNHDSNPPSFIDLSVPCWQHVMLSVSVISSNNTKKTTVVIYTPNQPPNTVEPFTTPNISGPATIKIGVGGTKNFKGGIANFRAYNTNVLDGDMDLIEQADIIAQKLHPWFNKWAVLKNIPFNYLVPDERMLPVESIRFFKVDPHWLSCLIDGAFSVGRCSNATLAEDAQLLEDLHLQPFHSLSGVLIRSASVGQITDLNVDGFSVQIAGQTDLSSIKLRCIRKEPLSDDTLLILFDGDVKTLQIYPAPETVHYGVKLIMSSTNPGMIDSLQKDIRDLAGTKVSNNVIKFDNPSTRMLNLTLIAQTLKPPNQAISSPALFAMEMLEGTWKIQINSAF